MTPVGGPSFLGLGDDRSSDLDYLLEDETPHGHGRLYLALLLLVLSAGLLAWHWQRDGYPWEGLAHNSAAGKATASSSSEPAPVAAQPAPTPAPGPITPDAAEASPTTGTATGAVAQTVAGEPPVEGTVSPNPITVVKPAEQNPQPTDGSDAGDSAAKSPVTASAAPAAGSPAPPPVTSPVTSPQDAGTPDAAEDSLPKETPAAPTAPVRKPAVVKPSPTIPTVSPEDRLVNQGERYLYGRGVRSDCALAQRNLMIGARQSNPKAQTLLGAMYATGHCVNRDLPTAYRWFAKALHGDPGNSRVQRDLEVLWKQMTPEERTLAMKSQ